MNPDVISYLNLFPNVNSTGSRDNINISGFRFNSPIENDFKTYIARVDFNLTPDGKHTLFARGSLQDDKIVSFGPAFPGQPDQQLLLGNSRGVALGTG